MFGHDKLTTQLRAVTFCSMWILERRYLAALTVEFPAAMLEVMTRGEDLLMSGDDAKMAKNLNNSKIAKMTQITADEGNSGGKQGRKIYAIESKMQQNFTQVPI